MTTHDRHPAQGLLGVSDARIDWGALGLPMPPAIRPADLPDPDAAGARLVAEYCPQCHGVPSPGSHSAADWVPTFRRMLQRMTHSSMARPGAGMHGMPMGMHGARVPTSEQADAMLDYLQHHSLVPVSSADLPAADGPGAQLFTSACSQCHALPSPAQHVASDWPDVVARMRQHMRELQVPEIGDAEATSITAYLQRVAATRFP